MGEVLSRRELEKGLILNTQIPREILEAAGKAADGIGDLRTYIIHNGLIPGESCRQEIAERWNIDRDPDLISIRFTANGYRVSLMHSVIFGGWFICFDVGVGDYRYMVDPE